MSEIHDYQLDVSAWAARNFPTDTPETVVLGLTEESGEVARASLKRFQGIRGTTAEWDAEIAKECADVFIKLCHVAMAYKFDLGAAIDARWFDVRERDWTSNKQGHGLPE